jgi:glycine hydroxymethyltransferase
MTTTHKTLRGPRGALLFSRHDDRKLDSKINKAVFPGLQGGPHMNQTAAIAVALHEANSPDFQDYVQRVTHNAQVLSETLQQLGWNIISGGTDTHLILVDTWMDGHGLPGKLAQELLEAEGIIVNKNTIPGDTRSTQDPSGIRLGTAAETTRGKTVNDMRELAQKIHNILSQS